MVKKTISSLIFIFCNSILIYSQELSELNIIEDFEIGIEQAKLDDKPIALIFTGYSVVNSRKLEEFLIKKNPSIFKMLKEKYVNIWLYVDDNKTGDKWSVLRSEKFNGEALPHIFILDSSGNIIDGDIYYSDAKTELKKVLKRNIK